MPLERDMRVLVHLLLVLLAVFFVEFAWAAEGRAKEQAERQITQPLNNAPVWRDVRGGENPYQTTQVRGIETNVLVQTEGQIWREIRNGPVTIFGGWLIILITALIALFYWLKGPLKLREKPTGRMVERFNSWERAVHWTAAISFVILGLTGLTILFGKYILLPVFGYTLFSWLATLSKNLHNFVGPVFAVSTILMFVTFVKDNIPKAYDWIWVRKLGGFVGGEHVPAGRFNAGQKAWFWIAITFLGIVSAVTGFIMDFPNFGQGRGMMQLVNVIHAISAVLFIVAALTHIYAGTIGVERAYETMRTGMADEAWAKEHHEYWYSEYMASHGGGASPAPSTAPASAVREGWKI